MDKKMVVFKLGNFRNFDKIQRKLPLTRDYFDITQTKFGYFKREENLRK